MSLRGVLPYCLPTDATVPPMTKDTIRSLLRVIATATMLVGGILLTRSLLSISAAESTAQMMETYSVQGTEVRNVHGQAVVIGDLLVAAWGCVLWFLSDWMSIRIKG